MPVNRPPKKLCVKKIKAKPAGRTIRSLPPKVKTGMIKLQNSATALLKKINAAQRRGRSEELRFLRAEMRETTRQINEIKQEYNLI